MAGFDEGNLSLEQIDEGILRLVEARLRRVQRDVEKNSPAAIPDASAWEAIIRELASRSEFSREELLRLLRHVDSLTRRKAGSIESVCFLGPIYSYSYLAAVKHFGLEVDLVPVATIAAGFEEVTRGHSDFAVVPIENSTDGRIVDTLGMFARTPTRICGEVLLPIHHCLLAKCKRSEIKEVLSKPQALSQCREWLAQHLPDATVKEVSSTTKAAQEAAAQEGVAAIASAEAGLHHGLSIVEANIEDNRTNVTRFAVIGNVDCPPSGGQDKTSIMFQLEHRPGALASAMALFQKAGVNLTWIESFPLPNAPNEYLFFVELEGHIASEHVRQPLEQLKRESPRLEVLGSYAKGE